MLWPGASEANSPICAFVFEQFGESGSETVTSLRARVPVFVTVIVKLAVEPDAIVCDFGFFVIEIAGVPPPSSPPPPPEVIVTDSLAAPQRPLTALLLESPL